MIFCCGAYHRADETLLLPPDFRYKNKKLEILTCPNCGCVKAELTRFNIEKQKDEVYKPKRKKAKKFIEEIKKGNWKIFKEKYGTRGNAGFVYGINIESKTGEILQYSVDFNGTKKLVKTINAK